MPHESKQPRNAGRRGPCRGARLLAIDPGWGELQTAVSQRLYRVLGGRSIAKCAAEAGLSEDALQAVLNARSDYKLSTLYRAARSRGYRLYVLFEPTAAAMPIDRS